MSVQLNEPSITVTPQAKPTPPPAPAAPAAAEPVKIPTEEELRQQTIDLYASMGWGKPPEKAPGTPGAVPDSPPAAEGAGEPQAQPSAGTAPGTPEPTPEPQAEPQPEPEPDLTTPEIIARAARETAREVARELRPSEPTPEPKQPEFELTAADSRDLKVIRYLEKTEPAWKGKGDEFLIFLRKNYTYQDQWLKDNPGKEFNPEDEEHAAWYEKHRPDIDGAELDRAEVDMRVEEKLEAKLKPQQEKEQAERAWREALPKIAEKVNTAVHRMTKAVDENLGNLLTENPTDETVKKVEETDPIAFEVMDDLVRTELEPMLMEIEKTTVSGLNYRLDPKNNAIHAQIVDFAQKQERELLKAPAEARELDGRQFLTLADYSGRVNRIINDKSLSEGEKQARMNEIDRDYWILTPAMVEELLADATAKKARAIIEKRNQTAARKFKVAAPATAQPAAQPQPAAAPAQPKPYVPSAMPAGFRPRPPSLGSGGDVVSTSTPGKIPAKSFGESAVDVAFSR